MATLTQFLKLYKPVVNEVGWDDNMNSNLDIVDAFVRQFMSVPNFQGLWVNNHAYAVGQITLDAQTSGLFSCVVAHTSATTGTFAQDRTARPTFWALANNPSQQFAQQAANSASAAATSATSASNSLTSFQNTYYGSFASDPLTDPHSGARTAGDLYFNTTTQRLRVFGGAPSNLWVEITSGFTDAPTTPAGTTFGRTDTHTWASVLDLNRTALQTIAGDVLINPGQLGIGVTIPPLAVASTAYASHWCALTAFPINLFFDANPAPNGQWRYIGSNNPIPAAGGLGAALIACFASASGQRSTTFYTTPTGELINANGPATLQAGMQYLSGTANGVGIQFSVGGTAFKPGGGVWSDSSDLRIKNIVGPYPHGLAELLEMLPKMYTYKGNDQMIDPATGGPGDLIHPDTTTQYIGLIAQDCEPYMPELVTQTSAYVDGVLVNDVRQLDATGVIYALVNAVAELDGRTPHLSGTTTTFAGPIATNVVGGNNITITPGAAPSNNITIAGSGTGSFAFNSSATFSGIVVTTGLQSNGSIGATGSLTVSGSTASTFGTSGTNNALSITPGAAATNQIVLSASGAGGIQYGVTGGKAAFLGATPVVRPTVTGSRGGNAALASLITALATLGLVVDSSTA